MGRKAFFIESKLEVYDYAHCDKCGLKIIRTEGARELKKCYWNPNPRASHRNICEFCHEVWQHEREERWRRWQEKHAALEHTANVTLQGSPEAQRKEIPYQNLLS